MSRPALSLGLPGLELDAEVPGRGDRHIGVSQPPGYPPSQTIAGRDDPTLVLGYRKPKVSFANVHQILGRLDHFLSHISSMPLPVQCEVVDVDGRGHPGVPIDETCHGLEHHRFELSGRSCTARHDTPRREHWERHQSIHGHAPAPSVALQSDPKEGEREVDLAGLLPQPHVADLLVALCKIEHGRDCLFLRRHRRLAADRLAPHEVRRRPALPSTKKMPIVCSPLPLPPDMAPSLGPQSEQSAVEPDRPQATIVFRDERHQHIPGDLWELAHTLDDVQDASQRLQGCITEDGEVPWVPAIHHSSGRFEGPRHPSQVLTSKPGQPGQGDVRQVHAILALVLFPSPNGLPLVALLL